METRTRADRFKALRDALGKTQDELITLAGDDSTQRTAVSKVENGNNQLTGLKLMRTMSRALGLSTDDLDEYLEGRLSLPEAIEIVQGRGRGRELPPTGTFPPEEDARVEALSYLRQPPQKFDADVLDRASRRVLLPSPEAARDPAAVADAVRVHILGLTASRPPSAAPPGTHRSRRR